MSYNNIAAMTAAAEVTFLPPASKAFVPAQVLAGCDYDTATAVDFVAARDTHRPVDQRGHYRVFQDTMTITGPLKRDPSVTLRRVFVHSSARAEATGTPKPRTRPRPRRPDPTVRGLGSQHYPTPAKVAARITTMARQRHVGDYLRTTIGADANGRPTLHWSFDQATIDTEAATDGWYALLTTCPKPSPPADSHPLQEPAHHQRTPLPRPERPLAVAPMFLHTNRRITALIGVVAWPC